MKAQPPLEPVLQSTKPSKSASADTLPTETKPPGKSLAGTKEKGLVPAKDVPQALQARSDNPLALSDNEEEHEWTDDGSLPDMADKDSVQGQSDNDSMPALEPLSDDDAPTAPMAKANTDKKVKKSDSVSTPPPPPRDKNKAPKAKSSGKGKSKKPQNDYDSDDSMPALEPLSDAEKTVPTGPSAASKKNKNRKKNKKKKKANEAATVAKAAVEAGSDGSSDMAGESIVQAHHLSL